MTHTQYKNNFHFIKKKIYNKPYLKLFLNFIKKKFLHEAFYIKIGQKGEGPEGVVIKMTSLLFPFTIYIIFFKNPITFNLPDIEKITLF